ncbi:MAG: GNAT family N-acetyltransferase [archaeon]|nr:MAG: GNAT family N-acetyltransferase [archaeon]
MNIQIRPIEKKELGLVNLKLPQESPSLHRRRFKEQEKGNVVYLIAWNNKTPIGHLLVRFNGARYKKVKKYLKKCPHLESLGVGKKVRRKGIATKIVRKAENMLKRKKFGKVGLAVEDNPKSAPNILYKKIGYKDWGHGNVIDIWSFVNKRGKKITRREKCVYLIKNLK